MLNVPSKEVLAQLRRQYPPGTRVELVRMEDPYTRLRPGDRGSVRHIDDIGTIFVSWDIGSILGVAYEEDCLRVLEEG